jgi:hypothetical protein
MTTDVSAPRSRRTILAAAIGGVAALGAHALGRPATALATDGQPIIQGQTNTGTLGTVVAVANATALQGVTDAPTGNNYGVRGRSKSTTGAGVVGQDTAVIGTNYGVRGLVSSTTAIGVRGEGPFHGVEGIATADDVGIGVKGQSLRGAAVLGTIGGSFEYFGKTGIHGDSDSGYGVTGRSLHGTAVQGRTDDGVAVHASAGLDAAIALKVDGQARFSRSGKATVLAGHTTVVVSPVHVTSSSFVVATIQGAGASGIYVRNVSVSVANSRFTIRLSKAPSVNTIVGWFLLN